MLIKISFYTFLGALFIMFAGITYAYNDMNKNLYLKKSLENQGYLVSSHSDEKTKVVIAQLEE